MLMDKNLFNKKFSMFIHRDWYDPKTDEKDALLVFLEHNEKFLIKPTLSSQGKGIELLYSRDLTADSLYSEIVDKNIILEGFIHQHSAMEAINPTSVNTVRIITARIGKQIHIVGGGGLRCGGKNAFVDNFHNGGYSYPLDIKSGIIVGKGCFVEKRVRVIRHPSSGVLMCGFQLPNWEKVLKTVSDAALMVKRIGYIAWDIAILEVGCDIIEANINYPSTDLIQLDDFSVYDSMKKFLRQYGTELP